MGILPPLIPFVHFEIFYQMLLICEMTLLRRTFLFARLRNDQIIEEGADLIHFWWCGFYRRRRDLSWIKIVHFGDRGDGIPLNFINPKPRHIDIEYSVSGNAKIFYLLSYPRIQ